MFFWSYCWSVGDVQRGSVNSLTCRRKQWKFDVNKDNWFHTNCFRDLDWTLAIEVRWLFFRWTIFFGAASNIGSSLNSNCQITISLSKTLTNTVWHYRCKILPARLQPRCTRSILWLGLFRKLSLRNVSSLFRPFLSSSVWHRRTIRNRCRTDFFWFDDFQSRQLHHSSHRRYHCYDSP